VTPADAPFAELVQLSRTSIADEMREEHRRRVLGDEFLNFNRSNSLSRRSLVMQSRGRKLQHGSSLAGNQARNLHNLAVREFKRIVMRVWIGHIDLTKPCNLVIYAHLTEKAEGTLVLDTVVER
jgi:hypothetical protein